MGRSMKYIEEHLVHTHTFSLTHTHITGICQQTYRHTVQFLEEAAE